MSRNSPVREGAARAQFVRCRVTYCRRSAGQRGSSMKNSGETENIAAVFVLSVRYHAEPAVMLGVAEKLHPADCALSASAGGMVREMMGAVTD